MNRNSFDSDSLKGLLGVVSKKLGVPPEKLKKELEEGKLEVSTRHGLGIWQIAIKRRE